MQTLFTILSLLSIQTHGLIDTAPIADLFYGIELYLPPERNRFVNDNCYYMAVAKYNQKSNWLTLDGEPTCL